MPSERSWLVTYFVLVFLLVGISVAVHDEVLKMYQSNYVSQTLNKYNMANFDLSNML